MYIIVVKGDKVPLKFYSFNTRGLGDRKKRRSVFQWLRTYHNGIILLQETHCVANSEGQWKQDWGGNIFFSHGNNLSRGVAIMLPKSMEFEVHNEISDEQGRFLLLDITIEECNFFVINIYAPTKDKEAEQADFISYVKTILQEYYDKNMIIGGDFNICLNPDIDKKGGKNEKISAVSNDLEDFQTEFNLIDIWRVMNPNSRKFTWRGNTRNGLVQSRLDFWLISAHMIYDFIFTDIRPGIKSDHSLITFKIKETQQRGRGFWKFNASLLKDMTFIDKIKRLIIECTEKYSTITNKALLWDVVKCEIRSEAVSYSVWKAKEDKQNGKRLEQELNHLEDQLNQGNQVYHEYLTIKRNLENFSDEKSKGILIRSRAQHIEEGEKCTKFFIQQEKRNYQAKYIRCLKNESETITNPDKILSEQKLFYKKLYTRKDESNCLESCTLLDRDFPQLDITNKAICEEELSVEECGKSLRELPNNKSPGSDGFTSEFYKFFWPDIKDLVFNSFQHSFNVGTLSIEQRRAVLTLLPKQNKDIRFLKNWRPLSL